MYIYGDEFMLTVKTAVFLKDQLNIYLLFSSVKGGNTYVGLVKGV